MKDAMEQKNTNLGLDGVPALPRLHTRTAERNRDIAQRIFLAGLATDFCVYYSALDACRLGFTTVVVEAGCRAIDLAGSLDAAWAGMAAAGVQRIGDLA